MDEGDFEGTPVLEQLATIGKVEDFFDAIVSDDVQLAAAFMKRAQVDAPTIAMVIKKMEQSDGEHWRCIPMKYPSWIPDDVVSQLDPREFVPYVGEAATEADALADRLRVFIATYASRRPTGGLFRHLCRTFAAAPLATSAVDALRAAEQRCTGTTFVAYARPLRRLD